MLKCSVITILWFFSINLALSQGCKEVKIVPYESKRGKIDKFKLSQIVSEGFRSNGFIVKDSLTTDRCTLYICQIRHSEHYWKYEKDTVTLTIYKAENILIGRYIGITNEIEMTFKSGFSKATRNALDQIPMWNMK